MAAPSRKATNPFYVLLVLVGVLFFVTASAYGVMMVQQLHVRDLPDEGPAGRPLLRWLDEHGAVLLLSELAVLGLATAAAIGTDQYWARRAALPGDLVTKREQESSPANQG